MEQDFYEMKFPAECLPRKIKQHRDRLKKANQLHTVVSLTNLPANDALPLPSPPTDGAGFL
jgi:hypothetical protein